MKFLAGVVGAAMCIAASPALAISTTYSYTGTVNTSLSAFLDADSHPNVTDFGPFMTGSVTFDFDTTNVTGTYLLSGGNITALSLASGIYSTTQAEILGSSFLTLTSGNITQWEIRHPGTGANTTTLVSIAIFGFGHVDLVSPLPGFFAQSLAAGVWTELPGLVETPLPAALPLFATGLGFLGWAARRRKQKIAALQA